MATTSSSPRYLSVYFIQKFNFLFQVMIAQSKSSGSKLDFNDDTALNRLFVVCPRSYTEEDLRCKFEDFGDIEYVQIVRDHSTKEPKGFGYVKFTKASTAAVALENCDKTLKAVMAEPKSAKIARNAAAAAAHMHASYIPNNPFLEQANYTNTHTQPVSVPAPQMPAATPVPSGMGMEYYGNPNPTAQVVESITTSHTPTRLFVIVATTITQDQLGRLFDIIPGMEHCELKRNYNTGESKGFAYVTYNSVGSAIYAKEKLHGFEYPPGMKLVVKYAEDPPSRPNTGNSVPGQVRTAGTPLSQNNTPYKLEGNSVYTTAALPAPAPLSDPNSECASRLFLVCNPAPPPEAALKDVFSRFGNLIDVYIMKDRNFGYAKFSAKESAECAIEGLHGHEVLGMRLKVMHADPPKTEASRKRPRT